MAGQVAFRELFPEFERHLRWYTQKGEEGLLFIGRHGAPFRRSTFGRKWRRTRKKLGLDHLRFYDLRHTGNVLAAVVGIRIRIRIRIRRRSA
ncbi:hypothetical protein [Kitasatospora sp. NPDC088264]|uniref:hypothetical protein n=1 Tax=unclassified Kitasatospora TaxID=2633591 RepID=UPI0034160AA5